jgi:hypothetical protein
MFVGAVTSLEGIITMAVLMIPAGNLMFGLPDQTVALCGIVYLIGGTVLYLISTLER